MNRQILTDEVQQYIQDHLKDDVHKIAMAKSPFTGIEAKELANQINAKHRSAKKLPTWYTQSGIYYPPVLSIEQCSSETTAAYKAKLIQGQNVLDLTGGFGVDSYYFAEAVQSVTHCELNVELSTIAAYNATLLGQNNICFIATDGIEYLTNAVTHFDTIYIDPARRTSAGKVFFLKDCTPNIVEHLDLLLSKAFRVIVKTAPLLDIAAGLKELKHVAEVHIISVKNECKELLWVIERNKPNQLQMVAATLNKTQKVFSFLNNEKADATVKLADNTPAGYLYEPDTALLKSGAFNRIGITYGLEKLHNQTQLYTADVLNPAFPGRIFKINSVISSGELKKEKKLIGNVIVRNYRDKAENLVKKYKIKPDDTRFLIFTESKKDGYIVISATIEQHY